jgi:hypothetical protein
MPAREFISPTLHVQAIVTTIRRKIDRSIDRHGLAVTIQRCATYPFICLSRMASRVNLARRRKARREAEFDRLFHIDTRRSNDPGWMGAIASPNWKYGLGYDPADIALVRGIFGLLDLAYENFVFVDYGSGKGRVLFLAAEWPFRRILGVEYSSSLHQAAEENIRTYRNPSQRCRQIESVCIDATRFEPPTEPLVCFFHNPFEKPVFLETLSRLEASLRRHPRKIVMVLVDPQWAELLAAHPDLWRLRHESNDPGQERSLRWAIFESWRLSNERV